MKFTTWEIIRSYLFGVTMETSSSEVNPVLEVCLVNNKPRLNAARVNYSFGALHKVFQKAFRQIDINNRDIQDVLILGFGAGSVASILVKEYHSNCRITGVESDPEVIRLAKKYFRLDSFPGLDLIVEDACSFVGHHDRTYDLVVIDVYDDFRVPGCCETEQFIRHLHKLINREGMVVFNKMIFNRNDEEKAVELVDRFGKEFNHVKEIFIRESVRHLVLVGMNQAVMGD